MVGAGKTIGLVSIILGVVIFLGAGIFVFGQMNQKENGMQSGGAALTMCFALIIAAAFVGAGIWFNRQGTSETVQFAEVEKEKRILNMVSTQGTVQISSMALEMNMPLDKVKAAIYDLVGKGLFTGYVDWKAGKLVSSEAAVINQAVITGKCPNCGAPQVVAGKGVIRCEYCGAEFFLPPGSTPPPGPAAPTAPSAPTGPTSTT